MMRMPFHNSDDPAAGGAILFPSGRQAVGSTTPTRPPNFELAHLPDSAEQVYDALDQMSRRIDDLARDLNCLGYFYGDDDDPRAA